jgi:Tol biopolymer transport system component
MRVTAGPGSRIRPTALKLLAGVAVLAMLQAPVGSHAASGGDDKASARASGRPEIVFASDFEIWTMDRRGAHRRRLTASSTRPRRALDNTQPTWSADASRIAWVRNGRQLWVMNWDGSHKRKITTLDFYDDGEIENPTWSANGNRIAYQNGPSVWVVNLAQGVPVELTRWTADSGYATWPDWSPDGRWIAYWSNNGGDVPGIWAMKWDGSDRHLLYATPHGVAAIAWSPNGRRIAFSVSVSSESRLMVMRSDGTKARQVTSGYNPTWLAGGKRLVFEGYPGLPGVYPFTHLFRTDLKGRRVRAYEQRRGVFWEAQADGRPRLPAVSLIEVKNADLASS